MVRISIDDLEKALKYIKTNSHDVHVSVYLVDEHMEIKTFDRASQEVTIYLYREGSLFPQVRKTERL